MEEDKDPFAAFGGVKVTAQEDPFKEFGGMVVKKKPTPSGGSNTSGQSANGLDPFQSSPQSSPQSTDLTPVLPQYRDEVRQQRDNANKRVSDNLKAQQAALDPEHREAFAKAVNIAKQPDEIREDKAGAEHYNYMQTPIGKTLGALQYMGSKATKGTLQIARGATYLAELGGSPIAYATGANNPGIDAAFQKADEHTNFGLTKGDQQRMEENPVTANLGGLAEFLPAAAAASGTGGATFYLQGLGQGKEAIDHVEKSGAKINPLVKNAFILGTGAVNGLLMGELGSSMFKSLPAGLRGDITAKITADAIKEASGKELTGEAFKSLLDKGAKDFSDNLARGGIKVLQGYKHAVQNLSALHGANFALKKGVDVASHESVFNENLGDLASGLNDVATKQAPFFSIPAAIGAISKLTPYSDYKNTVVESLMHDSTPENIEQTKQDIADYGHKNGWRTEDIEASIEHVDKIGKIAKSLPNNLPEKKLVDAVDLVQGRNDLQAELAKEQEGRKQLDPSMQEIINPNEQMLINKIDQANDKLKDIATDSKTTYSKGFGEEDGKFFKTVNGKQEEITPSRYELEVTERPEAKRAETTEPMVEKAIGETELPSTTENVEIKPTEPENFPEIETVEPVAEPIEPAEPIEQPKEKTSSIKNAKIDEDRVKRGLSPLMSETAKDFPKVWDEAMERLSEDADTSKDLVKELSAKPRSTTDVENALLTHRLVEVKNKYDKLTEDIIKAQDEGKDTEALNNKLDEVSDELNIIEQVSKDTGRETARGLNSRKLMLKDDFSLAALETKKRVALGRKLTTEERESIRKIHAEYEKKSAEYEAKIEALEQRNRDLIERDALNRLKAEAKAEGRAKTRSNRQQNKQDLIQDIRAKLKQSRGTLSASPIPYLPELIKISPELAKLAKLYIEEGIDKLDELVDKIHEDLKEGFEGLTKREVRDAISGYGKDQQEQTKGDLQKKLDELRLQAKLQSKLEDLEAKEFKTPERKKKAVADDIAELRKKIKDLQQPETSLKALKTRTENSIKEYERRLREKDFSTAPPRKPIELDPEAIKSKANLQRVRDEYELELERDRLNNRSTSEKVVDKLLAWRRGILLSSVVTLGKIATAAGYRIIGTPLHEIAGTLLRQLPLLKRIAAKAPREGHAFNLTAEQKAIASLWDADTWQQVKKKILGKNDDIDTVFGDKKTHVDGKHLLEIFGNLHGAEKELVKVNEFKRSVELRTKYYDENGIDIHNPLIQVQIGMEAYKDANRSIFMSDNIANNSYKTFTGYLESKSVKSKFGSAGRNAAAIARALLPIVKVPTNYLIEKTQYIPAVGALKAFNIMRKGTEEMTPEQSDYVMRVMKKQGLGYGLLAIGYLNPTNIGGLYVPGEKRVEGDLKANDLIVYGVHVPHWMTHTPMLTILQLGATIRRAVDAYDPKAENGGSLAAKGALATLGDVAESTPFYSMPKDVMGALEGTEKAKGFIGDFLRSLVVPPDVKRLAEMNDKDEAGNEIKRKPETILQGIEVGIPGLRKNVPIKSPRAGFNKITIDGTERKLSNDQLQDREKFYQEYNNSHTAERIKDIIAKAKTDKIKEKFTKMLHTNASNYSKIKLVKKYGVKAFKK